MYRVIDKDLNLQIALKNFKQIVQMVRKYFSRSEAVSK